MGMKGYGVRGYGRRGDVIELDHETSDCKFTDPSLSRQMMMVMVDVIVAVMVTTNIMWW